MILWLPSGIDNASMFRRGLCRGPRMDFVRYV